MRDNPTFLLLRELDQLAAQGYCRKTLDAVRRRIWLAAGSKISMRALREAERRSEVLRLVKNGYTEAQARESVRNRYGMSIWGAYKLVNRALTDDAH